MSDEALRDLLTAGARRLTKAALQKQQEASAAQLGVLHWLAALLESHAPMAQALVPDLSPQELLLHTLERINKAETGHVMDLQHTVEEAFQRAKQRGRAQANERDLAAVILTNAGFQPTHNTVTFVSQPSDTPSLTETLVHSMLHTPFLDQFGRDMTAEAAKGKFTNIVGRKEEIDLVIETLCRRTKRNPVLVGPAGAGKTAIVEGLAARIVAGEVPNVLEGSRVISLQPSILVAGANVAGEMEKRMKAIVQEASQEGILLFIDEIHTIMGAGGMLGTTDIGSMLKPALSRGDIACIAATTDDEYRRFIESDSALERRFQPIRINELTADQTFEVLRALRAELMKDNGLCVDDEILQWLIEFGQQFMRNRYFPDKAVDLLEQVYAHAVAQDKTCVELSDAQHVAERMVGMPLVSKERLGDLEQALKSRRLLTDAEIQELVSRLQVTMRGLDMRTARPNAVVLMAGDASENGQSLSQAIAETLFDDRDRIVAIDFSRFGQPEDISLLLGAPPGYVGYSDRIPLHQLIQTPWCVLFFDQVDLCHPRIREVVAQALLDGWVLDGRGKKIYLSDAIVVMTSGFSLQSHRGLGFTPEKEKLTFDDVFDAVAARVGDNLAEQVDLYAFGTANDQGVSIKWLTDHFLVELARRFQKRGVRLFWDGSMLDWMAKHQESNQLNEHEWEHWVDRVLTPAIIPHLPSARQSKARELLVKIDGERLLIQPA